MVLTTGDVAHVYGGAFKPFINGVISNKDLASAEKTAGSSAGPNITNVGRVTGYDTPFPVPGQEDYYLPTPARVLTALRQVMEP